MRAIVSFSIQTLRHTQQTMCNSRKHRREKELRKNKSENNGKF